MSWTEVHDEAENLEHAVSDRLIALIDDMLGRPGGRSARRSDSRIRMARFRRTSTTRSADVPDGTPVTIAASAIRIGIPALRGDATNSSPAMSSSRGARARKATACSCAAVTIARVTIGARAASKVLVQRSECWFSACSRRIRCSAQTPPPATGAVQDHRQLVPGRRGVQPGRGHLPKHLRHHACTRHMGDDVHAGVARPVGDAPALLHAASSERRPARGGSATR